MSKRVWLILIVVASFVCALGVICSATGYLGYRAFAPGGSPLGASQFPSGEWMSMDAADPTRRGGTLRVFGSIPPTLDPAMVQDSNSAEYIVHLFSGLVTLNSDLAITPDLAGDWELGPEGRVYTFTLLSDAGFADGRAITAQDFVYSFERACSPELASPVGLAYLGDIVGATDYWRGRADHITGLKALDEETLRIEIDAPKAYFLAKLTYPTAFAVDGEQISREGPSWVSRPNGSGPFVLEEMDSERIVLVPNEHYRRVAVSLEQVEFVLDGGLPITMYENDQLDIVGVSSSEIERVLDPDNPLHSQHHVSTELSVQYLGLNVNKPPFDDVRVRQAFAHAIDKRKIADLVLKGTAVAASGILPPGMPDRDPEFSGLQYDPELARRLLEASSYGAAGAMPPVVLTLSGTSGNMDSVAEAILSMVEENLSVRMDVEQVDWPHFLRDLNIQRYQLFSTGWIGDYPDSQNFLDLLFHSKSPQNHVGYSSAKVDRLLEQARVESDAERRSILYREAERIIVDEAPWIPLTHSVSYTLVKPAVRGFEASASLYPWLVSISVVE